MKVSPILAVVVALICFALPACDMHKEEAHEEQHKIVVTSPLVKDVVLTQQYVCQIRSQRHIDVCAMMSGYLEKIEIKEGQAVKTDGVMFKIIPILYQAKLAAEVAERDLARLEYTYTQKLAADPTSRVVSPNEVALYKAKLDKAEAKVKLAQAEFNFATVRASFDGIVDRLYKQQGSLVKDGDTLTTLSDNSVMWVYFNVPEARYLEIMAELGQYDHTNRQAYKMEDLLAELNRRVRVELVLANGSKFPHPGKIAAIEAKFNNETGTVPFRADFPNPNRLLRHGQTGNVLVHRTLKNALVIPQRATFEILDKRYVFVIDKNDVIHQREIVVQNEMDNIYIIKSGLSPEERFVFEGVRQVHDGEKREYEFRPAEKVIANQNYHAE